MLQKTKRVVVRLEPRNFDEIKLMAREAGFIDVASFVRTKLFSSASPCIKPTKFLYEAYRGERRSFFCQNKLWFLMQAHINNRTTVSTFIKQAVLEKLLRDSPENKEVYDALLKN